MQGLEDLFDAQLYNPFQWFGIDNDILKVNSQTIIDTWLVLLALCFIILICRILLAQKNGIARYFLTSFVVSFKDLVVQTLGKFSYHHFSFITSLFIFIITCNWISLIPFIEEPTKDLNTTLALGLASFFYKEFYAIKLHGFFSYIKGFFQPFFLMFPLNIIGHLSKVVSVSFRLFGNIFGGSIISGIYLGAISSSWIAEMFGLFTGINYIVLLFFVIFEGLIQAFVFSMLTLTYLSISLAQEVE